MVAIKKLSEGRFTIPLGEVDFHPHSFADDAGRLFLWDRRLWRGIRYEKTSFFNKLFNEGVVQDLVTRGLLVESQLTNCDIDGYGMVVSHRQLPFVSYPDEWCGAMLKDAALTIVDLALALSQRGLNLRDAHPWNILFDWTRSVFVDLTSITQLRDPSCWSAYDEFCRFCYYPLILISLGHERIARSLLPEYEGIQRRELLAVTRGSRPSRFLFSKLIDHGLKTARSVLRIDTQQTAVGCLRDLRNSVEAINLRSYQQEHRERLSESMFAAITDAELTAVPLMLRRILSTLQPETILDLSRGATWTTVVPAIMGFNVVAADSDVARISALYDTAQRRQLPILPLLVDFIKPTPSVGYSNHYSIAATDRLKCDFVLALGLTDKLLKENHFSFDLIAEGLAAFSKRWVLVGFDIEQRMGEEPSISASGKLEHFRSALSKHFRDIRVVLSDKHAGVLLLCEK